MNEMGGISFYDVRAKLRSELLYSTIDNSQGYYVNLTERNYRSRINVLFTIGVDDNQELKEKFIKEAAQEKLINLGGHRSTGGMRISMYNAMPVEGA